MGFGCVFRALYYLFLLALAFVFCWQNIWDYFDGKTGFTTEKVLISIKDLPTLAICLPRIPNTNRKDFNFYGAISVFINGQYTRICEYAELQLKENIAAELFPGLELHLT